MKADPRPHRPRRAVGRLHPRRRNARGGDVHRPVAVHVELHAGHRRVPLLHIEKVTVCGAIPSGSSTLTVKGAAAPLLVTVIAWLAGSPSCVVTTSVIVLAPEVSGTSFTENWLSVPTVARLLPFTVTPEFGGAVMVPLMRVVVSLTVEPSRPGAAAMASAGAPAPTLIATGLEVVFAVRLSVARAVRE